MNHIEINVLREILYHSANGNLYWKLRPRKYFKTDRDMKAWNTLYAGQQAFKRQDKFGYYNGTLFKKNFRAHRVIWALGYGSWPSDELDHINGNTSDNRIENLRVVSSAENKRNARIGKRNTSGLIGIRKRGDKWYAQIWYEGNPIYLGTFPKLDEAIAVRNNAEEKLGFHPNHGRA